MNVALFDSTEQEAAEFIRGLIDSTGYEWHAKVCQSNQGRSEWYRNALRYIKYFAFPFWVFVNRRKYRNIIGWQAFYGLVFAFYCKLFRVKKTNTLIIKNFIYIGFNLVRRTVLLPMLKHTQKNGIYSLFIMGSDTFGLVIITVGKMRDDKFAVEVFNLVSLVFRNKHNVTFFGAEAVAVNGKGTFSAYSY